MTRSHRFTSEQVVAFLAGRLTQLRVPVKLGTEFGPSDTPGYDWHWRGTPKGKPTCGLWQDMRTEQVMTLSPFGKPGDTLWGKETWRRIETGRNAGKTDYRADDPDASGLGFIPWQPSSRMKQADSRISATVRRVWVERVQEISEADAVACGAQCAGWPSALTDRGAFGRWWMKRYGPDAWNANGFVWACEIEPKPEGMR